jgi:hypothetical protein
MARPERHDVDYFPFYVKRGKTLNILQSEYGNEGIGFFTNLMRFLALTPDHHYSIKKESDRRNFFAETGITDKEKGIAMIELMVETEKLDLELWEGYQVIVCPAFIESIKDAYKRRLNNIITLEEIREKYKSQAGKSGGVTVSNTNTETPYNGGSDDNNPETKPDETKTKKSRKEKNIEEPSQSKDALILADLLFNLHKNEVPNYHSGKDIEKIKSDWSEDIEKIILLDKKSPDDVRQVIEWAKKPDCFWFPNIQSGRKLRKQFETLYSQMIIEDNKKRGKSSQSHAHKIVSDNIPDNKLDEFFN